MYDLVNCVEGFRLYSIQPEKKPRSCVEYFLYRVAFRDGHPNHQVIIYILT